MKYFLFYAIGLAICLYFIDLDSGSFVYDSLAPIGAVIFGVLMFGWIGYRSIVDPVGPDSAVVPDASCDGSGGGGDL